MDSRRMQRRLAHALPDLVWLGDDLREALDRSPLVRRSLSQVAQLRRRRLNGVLFVAVTGSSGKSTTKELIAAVLGSCLTGTHTRGNFNTPFGVAKTILRTSRAHDFCVVELGTERPGSLPKLVDFVRPHVGVVTTVGLDHLREFQTPEAIAAEKSSLVRALPPDGAAILNADDPKVLAMQEGCAARVVTCGLGPGATVTAEDVEAVWPAPLSFTLRYGGTALRVRTSLYGRHWVHAVLAAIATGVEAGVPLADAAHAVERVRSFDGRMQPVVTPNGVTFIRDDIKAGLLSALPALDFLQDAQATRKIVLFGRITNFEGDPYDTYEALAARALEIADEVIFAGPDAHYARNANDGRRLRLFPTVEGAAKYLRRTTQRGDLVLLKGSRKSHLQRVTLAFTQDVRCWLAVCGRKRTCEGCNLLDLPSDPGAPLPTRLLRERQQLLESP